MSGGACRGRSRSNLQPVSHRWLQLRKMGLGRTLGVKVVADRYWVKSVTDVGSLEDLVHVRLRLDAHVLLAQSLSMLLDACVFLAAVRSSPANPAIMWRQRGLLTSCSDRGTLLSFILWTPPALAPRAAAASRMAVFIVTAGCHSSWRGKRSDGYVKGLMGGDECGCVCGGEGTGGSSTACGGWGKQAVQYDDGWVPRKRTCAPHGTRLGRKWLRTCLARGGSLQRGSRRCCSQPSAALLS